MFKENIEFIEQATAKGQAVYGILSITGDTFDSMRSLFLDREVSGELREQFDRSMGQIVDGLRGLDGVLELLASR